MTECNMVFWIESPTLSSEIKYDREDKVFFFLCTVFEENNIWTPNEV